jgi:hypothetical protein
MTVSTKVEVYGAKEAIRELGNIDKVRRRQLTKDAKKIAAPVIDAAKNAYPTQYLSGMSRGWSQRGNQKFPYSQANARKGIGIKVSASRKDSGVISIIQKDPAASIVDMAGKAGGNSPQGARFISALTLLFGGPSRVMWPAYESNEGRVEREMLELVEEVAREVNRRLVMN